MNSEDPKILESGFLQAASSFYKVSAIKCSRAQVSVALFGSAYQDVASLEDIKESTAAPSSAEPFAEMDMGTIDPLSEPLSIPQAPPTPFQN
ncbi:hypothetical protein BU15DRAFT_77339 [Melanogaster broomeanus]|nr:hypothetical protein BU15DRAFT_77339 [Melanogaster broomeanus]